MKILVVNVNTTAKHDRRIAASARSVAAPGTEIIGLTPNFGAESVEGNFESYLAAVAVMDAVVSYEGHFDAVMQAGFGEHGREGLQELSTSPSWTSPRPRPPRIHAWPQVLRRDDARPHGPAHRGQAQAGRVSTAGARRCGRVACVLELEERPEDAVKAIVAEAGMAVGRDKRRGHLPRLRWHGRPRRGRPPPLPECPSSTASPPPSSSPKPWSASACPPVRHELSPLRAPSGSAAGPCRPAPTGDHLSGEGRPNSLRGRR